MKNRIVFKDELEFASALGLSGFDAAMAKEKGRISRLLRKARQDAEITQKDLAKLVGSSQPAIARMEAGDMAGVSIEFLLKIATELEVPILIRSSKLFG